jgi:hypothetical protein
MTHLTNLRQIYAGARLGLGAAIIAGIMAVSGHGQAATITGSLAGAQGGAPIIDLLGGPYDFNAGFTGADPAGSFTFNFQNTSGSALVLSLVNATIGQSASLFFTGGVQTTFGALLHNTAEKALDAFSLQALLNPGDLIALVFNYGDPVSPNQAGPDIDFNIEASVVPLPAGLLLFLSGLFGIGFLGRYKVRRGEPAAA